MPSRGLTDAVSRANQAIQRIVQINRQIGVSNDAGTAGLLDERDRNIDDLSQLMDITVVPGQNNPGHGLHRIRHPARGVTASVLSFDGRSSLDAMSHWDSDPTKRSVGTLVLTGATGNSVDLIADHSIRSGQIKAYLEMRDQTLVQAQGQLDQIAAGPRPLVVGQNRQLDCRHRHAVGFRSRHHWAARWQLDFGELYRQCDRGYAHADAHARGRSGGAAAVEQRHARSERQGRRHRLFRWNGVDPHPDQRGAERDLVAGNRALAANTLRILDDGSANRVDLNSLTATQTVTSFTGGTPELPFFSRRQQALFGSNHVWRCAERGARRPPRRQS
jgi:flagellar hook-associated protein 1 FlgK